MTVHVRAAGTLDTREMADLLNTIIAKGGTTAMTDPVTADQLADWMRGDRSAWSVAENDQGAILGFQYIEPHPDLPPDVCDIATFVRVGQTQTGIGSRLFYRSRSEAIRLGYIAIDTIIRADNAGGLAYYQSRGFETLRRINGTVLGNGIVVDRIWKRYDLAR